MLMDLQMPVMGGLEATVAIRDARARHGQARPHRRHDGARDEQRSRAVSGRRHGRLSVEADRPARCCSPSSNRTARAPPAAQAATAVATATFDEDALRHRLSGDHELMTDVIRLFLEDLPMRLAAIKDAVTGRDAEALRRAAHALKGAAGNLSAGGLFEAAHVLERIGAESHMDAAEAAWRQLSVEASSVIDVLSRYTHPDKEPTSCAS